MVLIFLIAATVLLAYLTIFILPTDKSSMIEPWIGLLTNLDLAAIGFYFGSRGAEKIGATIKTAKK